MSRGGSDPCAEDRRVVTSASLVCQKREIQRDAVSGLTYHSTGRPEGVRSGHLHFTYTRRALDHQRVTVQFPIREQLLRSNAKQFQGGLVFKARRLLYHSTLGRE